MESEICINLISFGHSFGVPKDVDFVYSIRHLSVSFIENYRQYDGRHVRLQNELFSLPEYDQMLQMIHDQLISTIRNAKNQHITVAIGCEQGQHRSVAMIERLAELLKLFYQVEIQHRDLHRLGKNKEKKRERTKIRDQKYRIDED